MRANREILLGMYQSARSRFGHQGWWPGETPFEVAIGAILTQNTNWANVEKALGRLRKAGALSFEGMRAMDDDALREAIRPAGYFNQKARKLQHLLDWLESRCQGSMELLDNAGTDTLREELLSVRGVGPETADSILLYALGRCTFVVDAYTFRILTRHQMVAEETGYDEMKEVFEDHLPEDVELYKDYHAQIVMVGKKYCRRRRALCEECPFKEFLPAGGVPAEMMQNE